MNYTQFIEEIRERTKSRFEEGTFIEVVRTERNNGTFLQGITIREQQYNWAPTIYMEKFYMDYLNGIDIETIMQEFIELYEEKRKIILPDMSFYNDYRKARERFSIKLIHYGKNREFLRTVPHKPMLNLAMVVYCNMIEITDAKATIVVTNEHMKKWRVKKEELFRDALRNAEETMPCHIRSMSEVLRDFTCYEDNVYDEMTRYRLKQQSDAMLVLSNQQNFYGAACILYDGVLQQLADLNRTNYYILPSSVHEVILLPQEMNEYPYELKSMVKEINRTQVEPEEILSNDVYFFDRLSGKIMLV